MLEGFSARFNGVNNINTILILNIFVSYLFGIFSVMNIANADFSDLFKTLEQCDESGKSMALSLGICSYGVSMPTLEEVFLKLGR